MPELGNKEDEHVEENLATTSTVVKKSLTHDHEEIMHILAAEEPESNSPKPPVIVVKEASPE